METVRPYYAEKSLSAAFYDTVTAADPRVAGDLEVYASLAPVGGAILELGVGTGRLAVALAERGFSVVGVDTAPAMLAQCATRQAEAPPTVGRRIGLLRGDMTGVDLGRAFDLVVCSHFTLAHVPRGMAWKNTFAVAAAHLKAGGVAAFHLPRRQMLEEPPSGDPSGPALDTSTPSGGRLQLFVRERSLQADLGRLDELIEYVERDARGELLRRSLEQLTLYWADPVPLAAAVGLIADREPIALGDAGEVHLFLKA